jgi:hypothetical protein
MYKEGGDELERNAVESRLAYPEVRPASFSIVTRFVTLNFTLATFASDPSLLGDLEMSLLARLALMGLW